MNIQTNLILEHKQINHILKRIAFQIYESNTEETDIVLSGIKESGYILAKMLKTELEKISPIKVHLCEIRIDKKNPRSPISTSLDVDDYKNHSIIVVDDVLNSGSTLIYGVKHFLENSVKQIKTVVLVDRNHKKFPIKADYKGISLSTSLNENVKVIFEKNNNRAILE